MKTFKEYLSEEKLTESVNSYDLTPVNKELYEMAKILFGVRFDIVDQHDKGAITINRVSKQSVDYKDFSKFTEQMKKLNAEVDFYADGVRIKKGL